MVIVDEMIYYINNYVDGSCWIQKLVVAPLVGGQSTSLVEFEQSRNSKSLLYNGKHNALYMIPFGQDDPSIVKYSLSNNSLSRVPIADSAAPVGALGMDDKHLYFGMLGYLYRTEIF
jgi:hypothetical protein